MSAFTALYERLAGSRPVRRLADWAMGRLARRRVAALDRRDVEKVQERTLLSLVRHARRTRFGKDHRFDRIRSVADFQERVPLTDYEQMWERYWRGPFPYLKGVSW